MIRSDLVAVILITAAVYSLILYFDIAKSISSIAQEYGVFTVVECIALVLTLSIYVSIRSTLQNKKIQALLHESKRISETDHLTGINNRRMINSYLHFLIKKKARCNTSFSIILCDLDYFKNINDTYGHNIGDQMLVSVSQTILQSVRESDIVGRWGGEEFIVLCPETAAEGAMIVAEKLRANIEAIREPQLPSITASFGVAYFIDKSITLDSAIIRVDTLLYQAKKAGRNCIVADRTLF